MLTIPIDPTVATVVLLLLQMPPVVLSDNAVVAPVQTLDTPVSAPGIGFTVTVAAVMQPVGNV